MQITRETDYAVRCVLHLAGAPERVAMVNEIAAARDIPRTFLAKILQKLTKAGLVRSYRGVRGGFQLERDPSQISLLDVVLAVEGSVALNRCVTESGSCASEGSCAVHPVWVDVSGRLEGLLGRYHIDKLAREEKKRNGR